MKINDREAVNIPKPQSERVYEAPNPASDSASTAKRPEAASDRIDLASQSGLAALVQAAGSDERTSRVEQLRALVQSGQYQVDTGALSQSIVNAAFNGY